MARLKLGELLVKQAKLMPAQLRKGLRLQQKLGGRLGTNLLEAGLVREGVLLAALGEQRSTRTASRVDLESIPAKVIRQLPAKLASRYQLVPYSLQGKTLFVASLDIGDALIEDEIRMLTGFMVRTTIALELRVREALLRYYRIPAQARFEALAHRLAQGGIKPPSATESRAEPRAKTRTATTKPASTPPVSPPVRRAKTTTRPSTSAAPTSSPPPAEPLFIELDAEDEALLRSGRSATTEPEEPPPRREETEPAAGEDAAVNTVDTAEVDPETLAAIANLESAKAEPNDAEAPILFTGEVESEVDLRDPELGLEERLHLAAIELQKAEIRDEIADVLLDFCAPYLERRMLLIHRHEKIVGWRGEGGRVESEAVRSISIGEKEPSIFLSVSQPSGLWLAPLPPLEPNQRLVAGLGGEPPKDCLVLPVVLRSKIVCFLYGDNRARGVAGVPVAEIRRLVAKAGIAFEVYILKNKIRLV